jgi:hypothetical protein
MTYWLIAVAFWFVAPQLVAALFAWPARRLARANPNTLLPEIVAGLTAPVGLLALHALFAPLVDQASAQLGYGNAWTLPFVVPALIAHYIAAIIIATIASVASESALEDHDQAAAGRL